MAGYGSSAYGSDGYGDPRITQPSVLSYGAATGSGTSRTTASFTMAARRIVVFCCSATSGTSFPETPPVLTGAVGTGLTWTYQTRGHENGTFPRQTWMWSAYTGDSPPSGTITWTTSNSMSANAHYSVVQFEEGEVDLTDPIVRPSGYFPELPPDNGALVYAVRHPLAQMADPRNGILNYILLGQANSATVTHTATGFTRLAYQQSGTSWASITQWKDSQSYLIDTAWPQAEGGQASHYVSVACEIRAAGTDNSVGRIHDRLLVAGATTTDGTTFIASQMPRVGVVSGSTPTVFTTFANRDVWLAVTSARTAATPSTPVISDTLGWTWNMLGSVGYSTIIASTQKLWLFHTRIGVTNPGANTVTITYPETQTACAWQIVETAEAETSPTVQVEETRIDSGSTTFSATMDNATLPASSMLMFLAKANDDRELGADVLTGVVEQGWVEHEQTGAGTPGLAIASFGRHTPDDTVAIVMGEAADAAMIVAELRFSGGSGINPDLLDATPVLYTPKANESVIAPLLSAVPEIFTPQPSTTSFAQQVTGGGAFQADAFQGA